MIKQYIVLFRISEQIIKRKYEQLLYRITENKYLFTQPAKFSMSFIDWINSKIYQRFLSARLNYHCAHKSCSIGYSRDPAAIV